MHDNEFNPVIGMDLGTTFSCAALWTDRQCPEVFKYLGNDTIPSIVYLQESGTPLVGTYARKKLIIDPKNAIDKIKRHMDDEDFRVELRGEAYTPVDISAMILEVIAKEITKLRPRLEIAGVVVTHPHYFKYPAIARTKQAAEEAGLPVIRLVSEPVAAALDYGFATRAFQDKSGEETILVFDLGGGTFDVTVLRIINQSDSLTFKVLGVGGDAMLGGTNFDEAFFDWTLREANLDFSKLDDAANARARANLLEAVIQVKEELSDTEDATITVPNILPNQHLELDVTRRQFEEILTPFCEQVRSTVSNTIARAGLRPGELAKTIVVGGSSRIPIMQSIIREETGAEPWRDADPDLAVCRGAAILAALDDGRMDEFRKEIKIEEATSHALGVRAANDKFAILIPPNRSAPVQATKIFVVRSSEFTVVPYQGHGKLVTDEGVRALKEIPISGMQLGPNGEAHVKITFTVNDQQLLYVKIEAPGVSEQRQMEF
jgi:molecular chaperone DnaK